MSRSTRRARAPSQRSVHGQLFAFFTAAFVASWTVGGVGIVLLGDLGLVLGVLVPAAVAAVFTWKESGTLRPLWSQVVRWRVGAPWYAAALGLPVALIAVALLVSSWITGEGAAEDRITGVAVPLYLLLFVLVIGGPEEPAWRGYALPRLQERFDALTASIVMGGVWALWHLPLWFLPGTPQSGSPFVWFAVMSLGLCVIYTWMYNGTGGSVVVVMVFHAAWNLALSWLPTDAWAVLAALVVLVAVGLAVALGRRHLSSRPRIGVGGRPVGDQ